TEPNILGLAPSGSAQDPGGGHDDSIVAEPVVCACAGSTTDSTTGFVQVAGRWAATAPPMPRALRSSRRRVFMWVTPLRVFIGIADFAHTASPKPMGLNPIFCIESNLQGIDRRRPTFIRALVLRFATL